MNVGDGQMGNQASEAAERKYPVIQADNLRAVLAHIEAHPETWKQSSWHCGTSHCFGGWAQIMAGRPASDASVRADARKWLGLTRYEADLLFDGYNSIETIREVVTELVSDGYNRDGYDRAYFDSDGLNPENLTREEVRARNAAEGAA